MWFDKKEAVQVGEMFASARNDGEKTQLEMAEALYVDVKTVSKWEHGITVPNVLQWKHWFEALNIDPAPYYKQFVYGLHFEPSDERDKLLSDLWILIQTLTNEELAQHRFLLGGKHGSSPFAYLQKITADLQCPLDYRFASAGIIKSNYILAKKTGRISCPDEPQPILDVFDSAIDQSVVALINNKSGYNLEMKKGE